MVSGYGVLCEVMMADIVEATDVADAADAHYQSTVVTFKALAIHRFRLLKVPRSSVPLHAYARQVHARLIVNALLTFIVQNSD